MNEFFADGRTEGISRKDAKGANAGTGIFVIYMITLIFLSEREFLGFLGWTGELKSCIPSYPTNQNADN